MTMADQIVVMDRGRIEQIGTPAEIYFSPQSLMVARFVGSPSMNLMEARLAAGRLDTPLGPLAAPDGLDAEGRVTVGVRPDDLSLPETLDAADVAGEASFRVELIELLGARGIVTLRSGDLAFKAVLDERHLRALSPQADLRLAIPKHRLHVFDGDGRRVRANG